MNIEKSEREGLLSDEKIIELYWKREEKAIKETDKKYGKYLYTIAYNIVHDRLDCEECLNDTYLGTWNSIPPAKPTKFQVFLSKIMRNFAFDRFKRNTALKRIPSELVISMDELGECFDNGISTEEEYFIGEVCKTLNEFLSKQSKRREFIFVCRYYYADSVANIAKMLEVSDKTVYRELSELRKEFKEEIEKGGYTL